MEPSFNCWQPRSTNGGHVKPEGLIESETDNDGTLESKGKVAGKMSASGQLCPVFFPDLLELSSTPDGDAVCTQPARIQDKLEQLKMRIGELEGEFGTKSAWVRFDSVIVGKDAEIARLNKLVHQLEEKVTNLEDSLDELVVHVVTQSMANDVCKNLPTATIQSGEMHGLGTLTSDKVIQKLSYTVGRTENVPITTPKLDRDIDSAEDVSFGCADGCKGQNVHSDPVLFAGVGVDVGGVEGGCHDNEIEPKPGLKIMSMVRRVKNKPRHEYRLSDYEYPRIVGWGKLSDKVRISKSTEPGVIYAVEDVEVDCKTWNGFGMSRKHVVWAMFKDEDIKLVEKMYSLDRDGLIVWDGGDNGIQIHFTNIKDLVQQNLVNGNVIDAYAAMLTEMHRTVSGGREHKRATYVYCSVCSDMMCNPSTLSRTKYLNVHRKAARNCRYTVYPIFHAKHWTVMVHDSDSGDWKHYNSIRPRRGVRDEHYNEALKVKQWIADHHDKFVKPRVDGNDVQSDDLNGTLASIIDCPSGCGIFVCFIIRQYIRGADIKNTMDGLTWTGIRAAIVEMFLTDPKRGLRARSLQDVFIKHNTNRNNPS
ncbi:hypothetical protein CsSME_00024449 [Camellia sinensis var. sinensis]